MRWKRASERLVRLLMACLLGTAFTAVQARSEDGAPTIDSEQAVVKADFSRWVDYPLVKTKFGVYNSGYVPGHVETYRRDIRLFDEVRPDSLRFDGGLGSPAGIILSDPPMISGVPPEIICDFGQADELVDLLLAHNVRPYWCYSYVPKCLVAPGQDFRTPPLNLEAWGASAGAVATHFRTSGRAIAYHEIYNEPDNRDFFAGSLQDYLAMYDHAATAIREADPEASIGGPSLAFTESWIAPFLDHVMDRGLPLDFFSFHYYPGVAYPAASVQGVVDIVLRELGKRPELAATEVHLNEYNSLPIDYPQNGLQQRHGLASALLSDFRHFAGQPGLTKVHWAQFMDTGGGNWSGLISIEGRRKAAFNAYKIYSMMPVDRRLVTVDGPAGVTGMASSDGHKCALAAWNRSGASCAVRLELDGIPFDRGSVRVYRIDAQHASWWDDPRNEELAPVETREDASVRGLSWEGDIPDGGVVYVEVDDRTGVSELAPHSTATVRRVLHYYPDRANKCYADFDRNTWIARLGMAGEEWADAEVGVVADGLPDVLRVSVQAEGELRKMDSNSLLGVRLDYRSQGSYTRAVLFHGPLSGGVDLYSARRWLGHPWGTLRKADEAVCVPNCSGFEIPVSKHAPPNWDGRAIVTFILQNAGPGVRAKFAVR